MLTRALALAILFAMSAAVPVMEIACGFDTTIAAAAFVSGFTPIEGDVADADRPGTTAISLACAENASCVLLRSLKKVAPGAPVTLTTKGPLKFPIEGEASPCALVVATPIIWPDGLISST
jgi:hypothetical protein